MMKKMKASGGGGGGEAAGPHETLKRQTRNDSHTRHEEKKTSESVKYKNES